MEFITKLLTISIALLILLVPRTNAEETNNSTDSPTPSAMTNSNGSANGTNVTVSSSTVPSTVPPFTFSSCSDCNSMNITEASSQTKLLLCCSSFSRCCAQANSINCPTTSSSSRHSCSNFGPFCSSNDNCSFGSMCCRSTISGQNFRCCWAPR